MPQLLEPTFTVAGHGRNGRRDETRPSITAGWIQEKTTKCKKSHEKLIHQWASIPNLWRKALDIITWSKVWFAKVKYSNCNGFKLLLLSTLTFPSSYVCFGYSDVGVIGTDMWSSCRNTFAWVYWDVFVQVIVIAVDNGVKVFLVQWYLRNYVHNRPMYPPDIISVANYLAK